MASRQSQNNGRNARRRRRRAARRGNRTQAMLQATALPTTFGFDFAPYSRIREHPSKPSGAILEGRDLLDSVTVTPPLGVGATISNVLLNPTAFDGTRMKQLASSWEYFRYKKMRLVLVPTQGTTTTGQVALSWDPDPSDVTPPATVSGLREVLAHRCSTVGPVWQALSIEVKPETDDHYFTNTAHSGDERLVFQGQVYVMAASALSGSLNWNLWMEYELEFWEPSLEETQIAVSNFAYGSTVNSPSLITNAMFNNIPAASLVGTTVDCPLEQVGDNKGFRLEPGMYEVVVRNILSAAGTNGISLPTLAAAESIAGAAAAVSRVTSNTTSSTTYKIVKDLITITKAAYHLFYTNDASSDGDVRVSILESINKVAV